MLKYKGINRKEFLRICNLKELCNREDMYYHKIQGFDVHVWRIEGDVVTLLTKKYINEVEATACGYMTLPKIIINSDNFEYLLIKSSEEELKKLMKTKPSDNG